MAEKVILILVDGMRPDGMMACGHPLVKELMEKGSYTLAGRSVFPSVTLPCHMSIFHSVEPARHGILTNTYTPQVRPVEGLFEQLDKYDKKTAMFYTWEQLRDLALPGHLSDSMMINLHKYEDSDLMITDEFLLYRDSENPDFCFLYLGETDEVGHASGWMSEAYIRSINKAFSCIERVFRALPEDYTLIVTADHGGHDRSHGTEREEDMTIPMLFCGKDFRPGADLGQISLLDLAPTVAALCGVTASRDWEGKSLIG